MSSLSSRIEESLQDVTADTGFSPVSPVTDVVSAETGLSGRIESKLNMSEEELAADFIGQKDLGEPGLDDKVARLALADADTAGEKISAFRRRFPEGDLFVTPGTGELLFRKNKAEPFAKVDAGLMEKFEPVGDLIDFFGGDLGAITGELLLTKGGGSLVSFLGRLFTGGFFGELGQQKLQDIRGVQEQELTGEGGQLEQAGVQGTISVGGGTVGKVLGKTVDAFRGGGVLPVPDDAARGIRAGERLGLKRGLTAGEATDVPIVSKLEGQAGATLPSVGRYIEERSKELAQVVTSSKDPVQARNLLSSGSLLRAHQREADSILSQTRRGSDISRTEFVTPATKLSEGGAGVNKGIAEYSKRSQGNVTDAYNIARGVEEPRFDITELQRQGDEILSGTPFRTAEGKIGQAGEKLDPELTNILNQIKNADPSLPPIDEVVDGKTIQATSTDQLRAWRSALWDLKTPAKGEPARRSHAVAAQAYNNINDVLKSPVNTSKEFRELWGAANRLASDRFSTLEKLVVIRAAKDETPAMMARRLAQPRQVDNLRTLKATIPTKRFTQLQDSFKFDLLQAERTGASTITNTLKRFDKETLDLLLTPSEQKLYSRIGKDMDKLNALGIPKIVQRQTKVGATINSLVRSGDTARLDTLFDLVQKNGGKKGPLGKQIRAGIINDFADKVLLKEKGRTTVSPRQIQSFIKEVRDRGLGRFLTITDLKMMANLDEFVPFIKQGADTGTSIQAAEQARGALSSVVDVATGQGFAGAAMQTLAENVGIGWLVTHGAPFLRGAGKKVVSGREVGTKLGATLALGVSDKPAFDPKELEKAEILLGIEEN